MLTKGANVNAKIGEDSTALYIAAKVGNTATAQLLVKHGAEVKMRNNNGETALQKAATNGREVAKVILKRQDLDCNAEKWLQQARF